MGSSCGILSAGVARAVTPCMHSFLTRLRVRFSSDGGFTLIELLVTMGILLIVLTTLTDAFVSGTHAETAASDRIQVQTDARLAVSKMRDDIHCSVAAPSVALNDKNGFSLALSENPAQCKALGTSGASPYVEWCTVPNGATGTFSLYRTIEPPPGGTPTCVTSGATFELTDIVAPAGGWPTDTQATGTSGVYTGNLWPTPRACGGHNFLLTQGVEVAVNSDIKNSPSDTYELDDNIALRNSSPCGNVAVTGLLQFAFWPNPKTLGSNVAMNEIPVDLSGTTNPNGTISVFAFGPLSSPPSTCTTGGTLVGPVTVNANGVYTISGSPWPGGPGLQTGTYYWFATYSGDTNNNSAPPTACGSGMPSTTVNSSPVTPTLTISAPGSATTVSGVALTATFTCSGSPCSGQSKPVSFYEASGSAPGSSCGGAGWSATSPASSSVTNGTASITATESTPATYFFCASYPPGDPNFNATTSSPSSGTTVTTPPDTFGVSSVGTKTAGVAFTNVVITAQLPGGGTDTTYSGTKTITFSGPASAPSGTAPSYPGSVTFTNGVSSTFSITLYKAETTTLTATQGAIAGASGSFVVNAGPTSKFVLSSPTPASPTEGTTFTVTINTQDTWQNPTNDNTTHTITWGGAANAPDGAAPSYASSSVAFTAGTAVSGNFTFFNAGNTTLTATEGGTNGSSSFAVVAGAPAQLRYVTSGTGTTDSCPTGSLSVGNGGTLVAFVALNDNHGNLAANGASAVTVTITRTSGTGNLPSPGSLTVGASANPAVTSASTSLKIANGNPPPTVYTASAAGLTSIACSLSK